MTTKPTHKSARELLHEFGSSYDVSSKDTRRTCLDAALHSLAELVRAERLDVKFGDGFFQGRTEAWNNAIDHIALLIEGKQGEEE
jgi:hypothetical protein